MCRVQGLVFSSDLFAAACCRPEYDTRKVRESSTNRMLHSGLANIKRV